MSEVASRTLGMGLVAHITTGDSLVAPTPCADANANKANAMLCKCKHYLSTNDTLLHRVGKLRQEVYYYCSHCGSYYNPTTKRRMCSSW